MKNRALEILAFIMFSMVVIITVVTLPIWVAVYIITGINKPNEILKYIMDWEDSLQE